MLDWLHAWQAAEHDARGGEGGGLAGEEGGEEVVGQVVGIKDLDDVLVRDVGGKLAATGKWPLVIDTSGQASVFLRCGLGPDVGPSLCEERETWGLLTHTLKHPSLRH